MHDPSSSDETLRHLGQATAYASGFDPNLLEFIPRALARQALFNPSKLRFVGFDRWVAHELMWRDLGGLIQVGRLFFELDCASKCIVESKSLKLYLFGFSAQTFVDAQAVCAQIKHDLKAGLAGELRVWLEASPRDFRGRAPDAVPQSEAGQALPPHRGQAGQTLKAPERFLDATRGEEVSSQSYLTHAFRSLCPVTAQPDFATVQIHLVAAPLNPQALADYLGSFFDHPSFHEACVEQIFSHVLEATHASELTVRASFTRRGGIEINPSRSLARSPFSSFGAWRQ